MTALTTEDARFIPYRRRDLVQFLLESPELEANDVDEFQSIAEALTLHYHLQFHQTLESLKDAYAPMNPDADTVGMYRPNPEQLKQKETALFETLTALLNKANFERITDEDLQRALSEESLFKIKLQIDFDDFEEILFFRRGESVREETLTTMLGLRKENVAFINYDRVVVIVKFKPQAYFDQQKRDEIFFQPGATIVKYFRNIPRGDLEMLFPNSEVRMKPIDKLMIGVPAAVGGVIMLVTKLGTTLLLSGALIGFWLGMHNDPVELNQTNLLALAAGFGTLGAFLWKQFSNFKNRKIRFMKTLADNLYFKNLDNNMGVFHRLIDAAEEEECKEAIIAYYVLFLADQAMTEPGLDAAVEAWFMKNLQCQLDFEIDDALAKLVRLGLVTKQGEHYQAVALAEAQARLAEAYQQASVL